MDINTTLKVEEFLREYKSLFNIRNKRRSKKVAICQYSSIGVATSLGLGLSDVEEVMDASTLTGRTWLRAGRKLYEIL